MIQYCIDKRMCRRLQIGKYFSEEWKSKDCQRMCDICKCNTGKIILFGLLNHEKHFYYINLCKSFDYKNKSKSNNVKNVYQFMFENCGL